MNRINCCSGPVLNTLDDIDELYTDLVYNHPYLVVMPDHAIWQVWASCDEESFQIRELAGQSHCHQIAAKDFAHAFEHLEGGTLLYVEGGRS